MKKILESRLLLVIVTMMFSTTMSVIATTTINSNSVSYSNTKTEETTVKGSLDELFNSVDINERLGSTDISSIGDGTVTGAINQLNDNIVVVKTKTASKLNVVTKIELPNNINYNDYVLLSVLRHDSEQPYLLYEGSEEYCQIIWGNDYNLYNFITWESYLNQDLELIFYKRNN